MERIVGISLIVVAAVVFFGSLFSPIWLPPSGYIHTGKALFSQGDYLEFKEAMASKDVEIVSIDVLNDDFPILVNYSFISPSDIPMFDEDIGKKYQDKYILFAFLAIIFFIPGVFLMED